MSHITIVINRVPPGSSPLAPSANVEAPTGVNYVSVSYVPDDSMTEEQVAHKVRQLYKQVRDLGA